MRWFGNNLASLRRWRSADPEVREEMRLHVELRARDLEAAGMRPEEALARARREIGQPDDVVRVVAPLAVATDRATSVRQWFDELVHDLKHAVRSFARKPGFTTLALLTIALGLGAHTAIFAMVNAALLAPLPFDPDNKLVRVREYRVAADGTRRHGDASRRTADAIATRTDVFSGSVSVSATGRALARDEGAVRVTTARAGARFTLVTGISPILGRTFTAQEEEAGEGSGAALISHRLWHTAFGADAGVLGRPIVLDGVPFTVVGVLPRGFHVPYESDVWIPARFGDNERSIFLLARLAPDVLLSQAQAALEPLGPALNAQFPDVLRGLGVTAVGLREYFVGDDARVALALMGAVAFLLLIACSNVALLLATRFAARQKEVAVRCALGCGRWRLVRQFVTEAVVLFAAGGALGLLFAAWLRDWLVIFLPEGLTSQAGIATIPVDARGLAVAALISVGTGTVFGLLASLRAARADAGEILRSGGRTVAGGARHVVLRRLVVAEVALALVLLTAAGVMIDTFRQEHARDLGFEPTGVLTVRIDLHAPRYRSAEARRAFLAAALERVRGLPGVQSAGAITSNPLCCGHWTTGVAVEGQPAVPAEQMPVVRLFLATPGYFETLRQSLIDGRTFSAADAEGAELSAIVSGAFVERFWPGESALGKRVKRGPIDSPHPWLTVVGVVASAREDGDYTESWYLPHAQHAATPPAATAHLMIRASGDPASIAADVRAVARDLDPHLAPDGMTLMDALRHANLQRVRVGATVAGTFAVAGLLLAALGLYGVLSFVVAQETREIAVRIALGAPRGAVGRLVIGRGIRMTSTGLGIGAATAWIVARAFAGAVGDREVDPQIVIAGAAVLLLATLVATVVPARRALRLDPLAALQAD